MMQNPSSTDIHQQMVQIISLPDNKDEEQFHSGADTNNNKGNEMMGDELNKQDTKYGSSTPVRGCRTSLNKLKRSATSLTPNAKESCTVRPSSVEEKMISNTDCVKGDVIRHDSPVIIEVKKPPTPVPAWDNICQVIVNKNMDPQISVGDGKSEGDPLITAVGDVAADTQNSNSKLKNPPFSKESRILKSSIPRFTKVKPRDKSVCSIEKTEKKPISGITKIPQSNSPSRPCQTALNQNGRKLTTPSRSRASTVSSRPSSPPAALVSGTASSRPKSPPKSNAPCYRSNKEKEKELHNMLEEMYSTIGQMKDMEDGKEINDRPQSRSKEKRKDIRKPLKVDYIMPAKDGAGETFSRLKNSGGAAAKKELAYNNVNYDLESLATKADILQCLSELNGQNQMNLKELHHVIKEIIQSGDDTYSKELEIQFYNLEQTQVELVQRLVRTVTKFYNEREALMEENSLFREKQDKVIPAIEDKVARLETENANLSDKLKITTHNLEEEKLVSQKKRISSQNFTQAKSKVQKAESKLQDIDRKMLELSSWTKKLDSVMKQKECIFEQNMKKIKLAESTISELEIENKNLKDEIENVRKIEQEKVSTLIRDCKELKEARAQVISVQDQLHDEVERREKTSTKLQETTSRLKSMEDKCKLLSSLVDSAKNEVKMKHIESADKELRLNEEISQLKTELQARQVMLKVAEDEVALTKNKLIKAESHVRQEQMKEKEISSSEEQLRLDLAIRDEQITQLQEQIKGLIEKKFSNKEPTRSKNRLTKLSDKQSGSSFNERVALTAQVVDLERTIDTLAKDNLQLNQLLNQKNLELDQRDRIVKMQTDVLKIRDELILLLKSKEAKHEEDIKRLNDIIQEREFAIAKEWNRALDDNWQSNNVKTWPKMSESSSQATTGNPTEESMYLSGTMYELYSSLEKKQLELEMMHQRVQQLEGMQDAYNKQRTRQEARISKLEMALSEKCLDTTGLVPILAQ